MQMNLDQEDHSAAVIPSYFTERKLQTDPDSIKKLSHRRILKGLTNAFFEHNRHEQFVSQKNLQEIVVENSALEEVAFWQSPPLAKVYPMVYFDHINCKSVDESAKNTLSVYLGNAILSNGNREILGIWFDNVDRQSLWLKVFGDMKKRGCEDIIFVLSDQTREMRDSLLATYPSSIAV